MTLYLRIIMINYSFRPFNNLQCAGSKSTLSGSLFLSCNTGLDSVVPASWQKAPLCQQRSMQGSCKDKDASLPGSSGCHRPWNMEDCFYTGGGTSPLLPTQVDWLSWATLTATPLGTSGPAKWPSFETVSYTHLHPLASSFFKHRPSTSLPGPTSEDVVRALGQSLSSPPPHLGPGRSCHFASISRQVGVSYFFQ